jgi:hypothetical protein|tara:strand:+ start:2131 stop:2964 length:834 start_codon:yes stop_codon:yes gene_type:complete
MDSRITIYSCITNGYDEIPDDHYYDPDIRYVMFTDGSIEHKGAWEFRDIPIKHDCPLRLSLYPKIMQHKLFSEGDRVVWIDGCYVMTEEYVQYTKKLFENHTRVHMRHPMSFTYYEEIAESYIASYNTVEDIVNITKSADNIGFDFRKYTNPILASFWNTVGNAEFNELWWHLSQVSTRCDQIAFVVAKQITGLEWHTIDWLESGVNFRGVDGKGRGREGNVGRRKKHPKAGSKDQWKTMNDMLLQVKEIVGMNHILYNKHWRNKEFLYEWIEKHHG